MEHTLTCPACGGENKAHFGAWPKFCEYCGSPLPEEFSELAALMGAAGTHILSRRFDDAATLLDQALALAPEDPELWILKLLCRLNMTDIDQLGQAGRELTCFEEFNRAMEYGSDRQKEVYERLRDQNRSALLKKRQSMSISLQQIQNRMQERSQTLREMEPYLNLPTWRRVLQVIEKIFMIANVLFWTLGTILQPILGFLDAPFVVRLVYIIKRDRKRKKALAQHPTLSRQQEADRQLLAGQTAEYERWLRESGLEEKGNTYV